MAESEITRRPLKSRGTRWAAASAKGIAAIGLRPNHISLLSVVFAALACGCFLMTSQAEDASAAWLFAGAALGIQLRLLCNLFDGMVAVEGGFRTKSGEIYNELPDRFADALILAGAGYSLGSTPTLVALGWAAAALAAITAYVRVLGVAAGASQYFFGPMAKPQRMAVMTIASVGTAIALLLKQPLSLIQPALWIVVIGSTVTVFRRCARIIHELESK